jgi:hypothetical protein
LEVDLDLTSAELRLEGISKTLMYDWFDALEKAGMARRAPGREWGTKLYSKDAMEFLKFRQGKYGAMGMSRDEMVAKWRKAQCQQP